MTLARGHRSPAERLAGLPPDERKKALKGLDDDDLEALLYDWKFWARPEQLAPAGEWLTWMIPWGRGTGKTRTAAEFVNAEVQAGRSTHPLLVGANAEDVRDIMIEGESGILAISPPWFMPEYQPGKKRLVYPNGVVCALRSAHNPDKMRGVQSDLLWADEIAKWKYASEAWDNAILGNRLGTPRRVVTTTPKPIKVVRELMGRDKSRPLDPETIIAPPSTTYDNIANLAPAFIRDVLRKYQGTRLGRQELMGELLLDVPGALWTLDLIENSRVRVHEAPAPGDFVRVVVAIDPAVTSTEESNETGIIAAGRTWNEHYYVLRDKSTRDPAYKWAKAAIALFKEQRADRIVAEVNNGGDLVEAQIRVVDPNVPYKAVHASRGKRTRGEPVAALYEQGKVHHVGSFDELEDQMIIWVPDAGEESPDRVDALVWCLTELSDIAPETDIPTSTSSRTLR